MFKYPKKPNDVAPQQPTFGQCDDLSPWGAPPQQPVVGGSDLGSGTFGEPEPMGYEEPVAPVAPAPVPGATRNVLNSDVSVVGILRFTDDLLVDGSVEGEITSDGELTVGANASIQAGEKNKVAVNTQSAIIHGKVVGDIVVTDRVELAATAEVVGDITAAKISIQEGAVFVGMCRVGSPAVAPAPAAAPAPKKVARAPKSDDANLLG